jgi:hypothetical protein
VRAVIVLATLGACFTPAPREGFACGPDDWCPEPLRCAGDHTCRGSDADGGVDAGGVDATLGPANLAFVTSRLYSAVDIGNINVADQECTSTAARAGRPGNYVAWLSVTGEPALGRLGTASGWRRPDGRPFVRNRQALLDGNILYPLRMDESGFDTAGRVMTGTTDLGGAAGEDCAGLTSSSQADLMLIGYADAGILAWTSGGEGPCDAAYHLYCLQTDLDAPLAPVIAAGPRAFLSTPFLPSTGVDAADARCQNDADAAALGGTFKALLSTTQAAALARFQPLPAQPWVRVDGVATTRDFVTWDAPIEVTAAGVHVNTTVFSGSMSPTLPSRSGAESCGDWVDLDGTSLLGHSARSASDTFGGSAGTCSLNGLYCLEVP